MEYHQDRFNDYSLMIYKNETLFGLLPANSDNNIVYSHQGLSYGGLLLKTDCKFDDVLEGFRSVLKYVNEDGFGSLELKLLPKTYHKLPSDEIDYLLFKTEAQIIRRDVSAVIDMSNPLKITSSNRKRNLKKAKSNNIEVREVNQLDTFFNQILIPNLQERHEALPVHSVEEISELKVKFPKHIRQFNAYHQNDIIAGVTIFETQNVAHAQYISTLDSKKDLAGLDAIFDNLIHSIFKNKRYFSFGISNENQGQYINQGLLKWKESFGARAIVHDFYKISTKNYNHLNDVLI
ncbi:GNAT family N-acetyltransferase [Psychroserpens sp.]